VAGASANTNTLPVVPHPAADTGSPRLDVAVVAVMFEFTVIGKTGGGSSALIRTLVSVLSAAATKPVGGSLCRSTNAWNVTTV
jgi:hypothetical protein